MYIKMAVNSNMSCNLIDMQLKIIRWKQVQQQYLIFIFFFENLTRIINIEFMKKIIEIKKQQKEVIPISSLIDDFKAQQLSKRLNAVKNIKSIALALGSERIKNQLINFVLTQLVDDEDQVLLLLIDKIFDIAQVLGGFINNIILLPIFQALIQIQSSNVRQKAIDKFEQAILVLDIKKNEEHLIKCIKRIDLMEYNQTKQALVRLIIIVFPFSNNVNQIQQLNIYLKLASDQNLIIRKYAAKYSKLLIKNLSLNEGLILKIIQVLFKDKQQSNKIYLIETLIQLSKFKQQNFLQPYFNLISYQFTWRVRYQLISKIKDLAEAMGKQNFKIVFLPFYTKYLNDIEPQIRSIACLKLNQICEYLQQDDIINKIIPSLKNLPQDSQIYVRNALSKSLLQLSSYIGKKATSEHILPKFLQLLKDQDPEVRLNVFQNINELTKVLGIETLSQTTIPALVQISSHKNWRVRCEALQFFLYFAKGIGADFMIQKNTKIYFELLKDNVFSVRKRSIDTLKKLIQIFGNTWMEKNFLPKIIQLQKVTNYLVRQTFIFAIEAIFNLINVDYLNKTIFPIFINSCNDQVDNIRLNSCRVLGIIATRLKQTDQVKKIIKQFKQDKDGDVKFMANKIDKQIELK